MSDSERGPYDHQYRQFYKNRDSQQGYEFQHAPVGSAPLPMVTFAQKLRWWTWDRWKRLKRERAMRDRLQQDIIRITQQGPE